MIEDSFKFAQEDVTARKLIEARLDAGALLATTEKSLSEGGRLIAPDVMASIRAAVAALTTTKDGNDPKAIRARMADLEQAAQPLSVAMLDDSLKRGLAGRKVAEITRANG
jgi:molecular chaperone DnaK (HSP70)